MSSDDTTFEDTWAYYAARAARPAASAELASVT